MAARDELGPMLEDMLADPIGVRIFAHFLATEHSEENLMFYRALSHWQQTFENRDHDANLLQAQSILAKFLDVESEVEVNLSSSVKKSLRDKIRRSWRGESLRSTAFDEARKEVFNLMMANNFARFISTEPYELWQRLREQNASEEAMEAALKAIGCIAAETPAAGPRIQRSPRNPKSIRNRAATTTTVQTESSPEVLTRSESQSQSEGPAVAEASSAGSRSGTSDGPRSLPASPRHGTMRPQSSESKQDTTASKHRDDKHVRARSPVPRSLSGFFRRK